MKLELIQTGKNSYKIISTSNHRHPALVLLAELLEDSNKSARIKCGVYNIFGGEFSAYKTVYSYISERTERMTRSKFYRFLKGKVQMKARKPFAQVLKMSRQESKEIMEMFKQG